MRPKNRRFASLLIICLGFSLFACSSSPDKSLESAQSSRATDSPTHTPTVAPHLPTPQRNQLSLPTIPDLSTERLLFFKQKAVYLASFDDTPTHQVAEIASTDTLGISPFTSTFALSPDHQTLAYLSGNAAEWQLNLLDLNTQLSTPIYSGQGLFRALSWSPDSLWLVARLENPAQVLIVSQDADMSYNFDVLARVATWSDRSELVAVINLDSGGQALFLFDPFTNAEQTLPDTIPDTQLNRALSNPSYWQEAATALRNLNIQLIAPQYIPYSNFLAVAPDGTAFIAVPQMLDANPNAPLNCQTLQLLRNGLNTSALPTVLYQADAQNTLALSALTWFQDRLFFVQHISPTCSENDASAQLLQIAVEGGDPHTLAEQLDPRASQPYALSPDGRFIVWIGIDASDNSAFMTLGDLQNASSSAPLMQIDALNTNGEFVGFERLYWIPEAK